MCPFDHALEQMTARATDVEKRPVSADGIRNRPSPELQLAASPNPDCARGLSAERYAAS